MRFVALGYLAALLVAPLLLIFKDTFQDGLGPVWDSLSDVDTVHAAKLTFYALAIAVICNTLFGIAAALYLAHRKGPLPAVLGALLDLPLALSPVVVGLALVLVFANTGWFGTWLEEHGFTVMFSFPAIAIATAFVSLPFVARELIPVLREIGVEQQQAAATLGSDALPDVQARHAARDPPGADLRHRADRRAGARRVRGSRGRLRPHPGPDRDAHADRAARLGQLQPDRRLRNLVAARRHGGHRA